MATITQRRARPAAASAPRVGWSDVNATNHFVQFYELDDALRDGVAQSIAGAVRGGGTRFVVRVPVAVQRRQTSLERPATRRGLAPQSGDQRGAGGRPELASTPCATRSPVAPNADVMSSTDPPTIWVSTF